MKCKYCGNENARELKPDPAAWVFDGSEVLWVCCDPAACKRMQEARNPVQEPVCAKCGNAFAGELQDVGRKPFPVWWCKDRGACAARRGVVTTPKPTAADTWPDGGHLPYRNAGEAAQVGADPYREGFVCAKCGQVTLRVSIRESGWVCDACAEAIDRHQLAPEPQGTLAALEAAVLRDVAYTTEGEGIPDLWALAKAADSHRNAPESEHLASLLARERQAGRDEGKATHYQQMRIWEAGRRAERVRCIAELRAQVQELQNTKGSPLVMERVAAAIAGYRMAAELLGGGVGAHHGE